MMSEDLNAQSEMSKAQIQSLDKGLNYSQRVQLVWNWIAAKRGHQRGIFEYKIPNLFGDEGAIHGTSVQTFGRLTYDQYKLLVHMIKNRS